MRTLVVRQAFACGGSVYKPGRHELDAKTAEAIAGSTVGQSLAKAGLIVLEQDLSSAPSSVQSRTEAPKRRRKKSESLPDSGES